MAICRRIFADEPVIARVDGEIRTAEDDEVQMDLTFLVSGDLFESEKRVVPLVVQLMASMPSTPIEFVVLPLENRPSPIGKLVYARADH